VSLRRDILAMEDAGARDTLVFTDFGVVTTTAKNGPAVTRTMLNQLCANKPDVVVFELGDGILGAYGVDAILQDEAICDALSCLVLCANDPVGAKGGVDLLKSEFNLQADLVTGPATDNEVGCDIIKKRLKVKAINAITNAVELGDAIAEILKLEQK
jgi:hypothetical protein